jgi:4-hydroxy-2-oxoheptanedioate aldolase
MNLKDKLKEKYVLGTWSEIPTPYASNIIAKANMDFQIIDMEHGVFDFELSQNMIFAIKAENSASMVRVPSIDEAYILRALDIGADGIIFPGVESSEDILKIVKYCKYAPTGEKGFNPYVYTGGYKAVDKKFFSEKNNELVIGVIIESKEGLNNLEQIVQNAHIDIVYIGQYDLSVSLGVPGDVNNELVQEAIKCAVKTILKYNKVAGCMVHSAQEAKLMINNGLKFIVYKVDTAVLYQGFYNFQKEVGNNEII